MNRVLQLAAGVLRTGSSPWRLAVTLALGFSIGLLPIVGIPTLLCIGVALLLRLNLPAIQAANLAAWPVQVLALLPMVHLGQWTALRIVGHDLHFFDGSGAAARLFGPISGFATHLAIGWLVALFPLVLIMTLVARLALRRIPTV